MGYPVDQTQSYLIESFGTMQSFRKFPHSGDDWTRKAGVSGEIWTKAVFSGTIRAAAYDSGAGNYVVLEASDGGFWLYGHHARNLVRVNQYVNEGDAIGVMGATGFVTGLHLHLSRYTTLKGALSRVVATWVKNMSVDQWAAASGLTRPSNYYKSKGSGSGSTNPPSTTGGLFMTLTAAEEQEVLGVLRNLNNDRFYPNTNWPIGYTTANKVDDAIKRINDAQAAISDIQKRLVAKKADGSSYGFDWLPAINNNLAAISVAVGSLKQGNLTEADIKTLAAAISAQSSKENARALGQAILDGAKG